MKIVAPLNAPDEVEALAKAGADELYCGLIESWWRERYGDHDSISRRQGAANLAKRSELSAALSAAAGVRVPMYLAVNSRYTEPQLDYLTELCLDFEQMGGTGIFVSDIGLLGRLKGVTKLRRCLSLLAVADNVPTIRLYSQLEVSRVVLPRFVTPNEAAVLIEPFPELEAEVMAFFDKCPFVDGYCRNYHGVSWPDWNGPLEGLPSEPSTAHRTKTHVDQQLEPLHTFDTTFTTHACLRGERRYLQTHPCAACHLPQYEAAGVGFAKVGGRGRPLSDRLGAIRFLKQAQALTDTQARIELYQKTFDQPCQCYYGDFTQPRSAIEPRRSGETSHYWLEYGQAVCEVTDEDSTKGRSFCAVDIAQKDRPFVLSPEAAGLAAPRTERNLAVGSETDTSTLHKLLSSRQWIEELPVSLTIVLPPFSQEHLPYLEPLLMFFSNERKEATRLCVNDLGTLRLAVDFLTNQQLRSQPASPLSITIGSLLARVDDPVTVSRFLDPSRNPPRPVIGPDGEPRMQTYASPTPELIHHWHTPSALEPTAQATIEELLDGYPLVYEFGPTT